MNLYLEKREEKKIKSIFFDAGIFLLAWKKIKFKAITSKIKMEKYTAFVHTYTGYIHAYSSMVHSTFSQSIQSPIKYWNWHVLFLCKSLHIVHCFINFNLQFLDLSKFIYNIQVQRRWPKKKTVHWTKMVELIVLQIKTTKINAIQFIIRSTKSNS